MKKILRTIVLETVTLYLITLFTSGINLGGGFKGLLITGLALSVATYLIKPLINILILPLNLITFGLFKWVNQAITLYLIDLILPDFSITGFSFHALQTAYFSLPSISLSGGLAYVSFSLLISIISSVAFWLLN